MSDTISGEQMQAKIQQARREAEALKDRINQRKHELADASRMLPLFLLCFGCSSSANVLSDAA